MRTIVAPLDSEVEQELAVLDRRRQEIARRYIRRLALEPDLGAPLESGLMADYGCRRIYFDGDDTPDDLFGARRPAKRRGDQDLSDGPAWRIVYMVRRAPLADVRLLVVLAVGRGHCGSVQLNAYQLADAHLRALVGQHDAKGAS